MPQHTKGKRNQVAGRDVINISNSRTKDKTLWNGVKRWFTTIAILNFFADLWGHFVRVMQKLGVPPRIVNTLLVVIPVAAGAVLLAPRLIAPKTVNGAYVDIRKVSSGNLTDRELQPQLHDGGLATNKISINHTPTRELSPQILLGHRGPITYISIGRDISQIISASEDGTMRLWDGHSDAKHIVLDETTTKVSSAHISSDGSRIIATHETEQGRQVQLWDADRRSVLATIGAPQDQLAGSHFIHNSDLLLTTHYKNHAPRLWNARTGEFLFEMIVPSKTPDIRFTVSPDYSRLATAGKAKSIHLWDISRRTLLLSAQGHTDEITAIGFSKDGSRILTCSKDSSARLWDGQTLAPLATLLGHTGGVGCYISGSNSRIVTISQDKIAFLWDGMTGEQITSLTGHADILTSATFSPDGTRLITSSADHSMILWNGSTGELIATFPVVPCNNRPDPEFSPDSLLIATPGCNGVADIWDSKTGNSLAALPGHQNSVTLLRFSPDGKFLVTVSMDPILRVWPVAGLRK